MYDASTPLRESSIETPEGLTPDCLTALLDHVPQTPFYIKDAALRFVSVNAAMVDLCGARSQAEVLGKSARGFFPEVVTHRHESQDRLAMRTRKACADQLDLCFRLRGKPVWLLIRRRPVIDTANKTIGVAAIARKLDAPDRRHPTYERLAFVIDYIHGNFRSPMDICTLALRCGISASQLNRDFVSLLGLPPRRYLTKVRFEAALDLLESGASIVDVAHACGYADQSAFARSFRYNVGMAPSDYRRKHLESGSTSAPRGSVSSLTAI